MPDPTPSLPPVLDPEQQKRFVGTLPPVYTTLPSLPKPGVSNQVAPVMAASTGMPPVTVSAPSERKASLSPVLSNSAALPPVTALSPTAEEQRLAGVRSKLQKLEATPSFTAGLWNRTKGSDSVLGKIGHIGAGILRGVDIAGEIAAPNIARSIPGTGLNRSQNIAQTQAQLGEAEKEAGQASERSYRSAESDKASADAAKARRETELLGQPKEKEEKWGQVTGFTGTNGEPLEREENSGKWRIVGGPEVSASQVKAAPKEAKETQEQNKLAYQAVVDKLDMRRVCPQGRRVWTNRWMKD